MEGLSLEEIQNESFKILCKFKEICENHQFRYWLSYGTLLGAVRHKGFIPWDDDVDVQMPREDYEKFIKYCIENEEEIKPLTLMHYRTNKKYIYPIARLSNSDYRVDYNIARDYGLGTFIDIYPLDGYNIEDLNHIEKLKKMRRLIYLCGVKKYIKSNHWWKNIIKYPYYLYTKMVDINKKIKKADILAQKYKYHESDRVGCMVWELNECYKKDFFKHLIEIQFVSSNFKIPSEYDSVLKESYGATYMQLPPENERIGNHDYIVYKK